MTVVRPDTPNRSIVVLATAWGTMHGGINSFNHSLCSGLPGILSEHRVICVVVHATDADKAEATDLGVILLSLNQEDSERFDPLWADAIAAMISTIAPPTTVEWWVGHDISSSEVAFRLASDTKSGRVALIMHMSYSDYQYVKHPNSERADALVKRQQALLAQADMAFSVGPLLHERLCEIRHQSSCESLIPGLPSQASSLPSRRLSAITFGRFEPNEILMKQAPLAVAGFASAIRQGRKMNVRAFEDAALHVVGVPPEHALELAQLAEQKADRLFQFATHGFLNSRSDLQYRLEQANLSMMLSWHEGFGLTGWEAIGTGVPTILSRQSGVFRLLAEIGGQALGCIHVLDVRGSAVESGFATKDHDDLCDVILSIGMNLDKHLRDADHLSRLLRTQRCYTWSSTASTFATALSLPLLTQTVANTGIDRGILVEPLTLSSSRPDISRALRLAEAFIDRGQYDDALETIESATHSQDPLPLSADAVLLKGEVLLRLNRYSEAQSLMCTTIDSTTPLNACQKLKAKSILNTIHRDRGEYTEAIALGREAVLLAEEECATELHNAKRKLARALALAGLWQEGLSEANDSLLLAKGLHDGIGQGKAWLAIAEAYRHGLNQVEAIPAYTESRNLAIKVGHVDCYIWACLGLADSLFLVGDIVASEEQLQRLTQLIKSSDQQFQIESLHLSLSQLLVGRYKGRDVDDDLNGLMTVYASLGISWPAKYIEHVRTGDYMVPKRF